MKLIVAFDTVVGIIPLKNTRGLITKHIFKYYKLYCSFISVTFVLLETSLRIHRA